jgi:hypothetical protein
MSLDQSLFSFCFEIALLNPYVAKKSPSPAAFGRDLSPQERGEVFTRDSTERFDSEC